MEPTVTRISDKRPTLQEAQAIVGGLIEFAFDNGSMQVIVNEEGLLMNMPINIEASHLVGHPVVGPALVLTGKAMMD